MDNGYWIMETGRLNGCRYPAGEWRGWKNALRMQNSEFRLQTSDRDPVTSQPVQSSELAKARYKPEKLRLTMPSWGKWVRILHTYIPVCTLQRELASRQPIVSQLQVGRYRLRGCVLCTTTWECKVFSCTFIPTIRGPHGLNSLT